MICRALSPTQKNIIWFRKTGEGELVYYLEFNDGTLRGYDDDLSITIENLTFTYNGKEYTLVYDSNINGIIKTTEVIEDEPVEVIVGIFSHTTKITGVTNYSSGIQAVCDSLIQRLSLLRGELWYQVNIGLPLAENYTTTSVFDMVIIDTITGCPEVVEVESFISSINKHTYSFNGKIRTIYGESVNITNSYSI